ncbi:12169_t:CDS:1, partial [Cetraspora pellucida]
GGAPWPPAKEAALFLKAINQLRRVTWKGGSRTHSLRLILMQVSVVVA